MRRDSRNAKDKCLKKFGVSVTLARVIDVRPNIKFQERMGLRQQVAADRAAVCEKRVQEERRLLVITRGEREVVGRQEVGKLEQIQKTTEDETEKQLAITAVDSERESVRIRQERAQILLETARIDAQAKQASADAEAYEKTAILMKKPPYLRQITRLRKNWQPMLKFKKAEVQKVWAGRKLAG